MKELPLQSDYFISSYDQYANEIFRFIRSKTRNRDTALDLTQETFIRVWNTLQKGTVIDNMRAFLYTTARHLIIDTYRKHQEESLEHLLDDGHEFVDTNQEAIEQRSEMHLLLQLLDRIRPEYREIITLRHIDGLSISDIAELLGIPPNTVSVRLGRALKHIQNILEQPTV